MNEMPPIPEGLKRTASANPLPANISVAQARLPQSYEAAKTALANCASIDECQGWANKADALASYAKQAEDEELFQYAQRVRARAIRRAGELLLQLDARGGDQSKKDAGGHFGRYEAGHEAGMSDRQVKTAVRVANVPTEQFDEAVESESPPTVTKLAEAGKKTRPLVDLDGRDPEDFYKSTQGQGHLRRLFEFAGEVDPTVVAKGALPNERAAIRRHIAAIDRWLDRLVVSLES